MKTLEGKKTYIVAALRAALVAIARGDLATFGKLIGTLMGIGG